MILDPSTLFLYRKNELLKSLFDGLDLSRNSAEYMMAYANLNVKPTDALSMLCKSAAMDVLILKDEEKAGVEGEGYSDVMTEVEGPKKFQDPFAPVMVGAKGLSSEPSRHPWRGKFPVSKHQGIRRASWPGIVTSPDDNYHNTHPWMPAFHPLLRTDGHTGRPRFVEVLKRMYLPETEKEKAKSHFIASDEKKWHDHAVKTESPVVLGQQHEDGRKFFFGGPLTVGGAVDSSNHDLYERDFRRWKLDNGYGNNDDSYDLRKEHFDSRADEWQGEDTTYVPPAEKEFSYEDVFEEMEGGEKDDGTYHGHGLGWADYMLGLEWLSPEERTAVFDHLENQGSVSAESQRIKLPDGTILPAGRFIFNAQERMSPEINWWQRAQSTHSPNMAKKMESNENDFFGGENRFIQLGLNEAAHDVFYRDDVLDKEQSIADVILEKLHELHPNFGEEEISELNVLPRFGYHVPKKWEKRPKSYEWENIVEATKNHKTASHETISPENTRLSVQDLLFLAGYNPETEEPMLDHSLYGELENPIIPKEDIDVLLNSAKAYSGQALQAKDIRNLLANKRSRWGPKPEHDENELFNVNADGTMTTTHAHHWWEPFAEMGGCGRPLPTYVEFIHHMLADPKTQKSIFGEMDDDGRFHINRDLIPISGLIAPEVKPLGLELVPDFKAGEKGIMKISRKPITMPPESVLSQYGVTHVRHNSDGSLAGAEPNTTKNNFTDNMSSTSGKYMNELYSKSKGEHEAETGKQGYILPMPFTESTFSTSEIPYGEGPSDKISERQAIQPHHLATALGRIRPFEEPQKKKFLNFNALSSGNHPLSTGDNLQDFLDFIGYSDYRRPSLDTIKPKQLPQTTAEREMQNAIRVVSRHLNTRNPHDIAQYLNDGDYTDMSAVNQQFLSTLMDEIGHLSPDIVDQETPQQAEQRFYKEKEKQINELNRLMSMGAFGPSLIGEDNIASELMELENLRDTIQEGVMSPEDIALTNDRIKELKSRLHTMQSEASNIQPKAVSNWWTDRYKQRDAKIEGDLNAVTQMAQILLPQIMEAVPNAFPKDDKIQFLHDSSQLMRMATRALLTMEHNEHGLRTHAYGIDTMVQESKGDIASGETHSAIANHLATHGSVIDGNMSVNQVLAELGLPNTPKHKEHVRQVIDQSNQYNTPLHVSTMHSLLTDGKLNEIHERDLTPYHGDDYHKLLDEGQKSDDKTQWKNNNLHAIPRHMKQHMDEKQFAQAMQAHGLNFIHSDLHGTGGVKKNSKKWPTKNTKNSLDSLYVFNPDVLSDEGTVEQTEIPDETVKRMAWANRPISSPTPESHASIMDLWDAGRMDTGWTDNALPSFGMEIGTDGKPYFGPHADRGPLFSVPEEILNDIHGQDTMNEIMGLPGVSPQQPHQYREVGQNPAPATQDPYDIATGEMTDYLVSLLNPDVLLTKASKDDWIPLIRPMHRIFTLDDLKEFKGFSDSWVVSTWYEGKRLLLVKDDDVIFFDENGKKSGVPKKIRDAAPKLSDNDFIVDGILKDDEFFVHDIISYDGSDTSDMKTNERLKILRGQLESHDGISVPGPFNTRVTDREGLDSAVNELKEDGYVLLRDAQSTYMKGEKRHPKWLILREGKTLNFIILDKRGKGPFTYQLGAGPILTPEGLGNRAVEYKGKHYMDVGTAHRVAKPFAEGDIVEGKISGVTKKTRGGRDIFNVQFTSIEKEGEGEGPASAESLSLLTKSFPPVLIPHDIDFDGNIIKILLNDIDIVEYTANEFNGAWYLNEPVCVMGDLKKSNYSLQLSESLRPFWSPVATLMLKGYVEKLDEEDEINVVPKKVDPKRIKRESAGVLDQKESNILLKPSMVKALEIALRALDVISKERMTWTGPKGLGIDMATPVESPRGPTNLRDESTLPDYDMRPRPGEDAEKPLPNKEKRKERLKHAKLQTDEGESIDFDVDDDQPTVRFS